MVSKMAESKFLQIECPRCKNNQITYGKATLWVKCKSCKKLLIKPQGGKAKIKAAVKKVI